MVCGVVCGGVGCVGFSCVCLCGVCCVWYVHPCVVGSGVWCVCGQSLRAQAVLDGSRREDGRMGLDQPSEVGQVLAQLAPLDQAWDANLVLCQEGDHEFQHSVCFAGMVLEAGGLLVPYQRHLEALNPGVVLASNSLLRVPFEKLRLQAGNGNHHAVVVWAWDIPQVEVHNHGLNSRSQIVLVHSKGHRVHPIHTDGRGRGDSKTIKYGVAVLDTGLC